MWLMAICWKLVSCLFIFSREKYNVLFPNKAQLLGFKVFTKTLKLFWIVQSSVNRDPFTFDSYV